MSTVPTTAASVNPPATCVASLEWDQVLSPDPLLPPDGTDRWHAAVTTAAHTIANHPDFIPESKRLAAAIALARARAVRLLDNDKAQVRSGTVTYELGPACPCQDALRVSKYCKHFLATLITKEAYAQVRPAPSRSTAPCWLFSL